MSQDPPFEPPPSAKERAVEPEAASKATSAAVPAPAPDLPLPGPMTEAATAGASLAAPSVEQPVAVIAAAREPAADRAAPLQPVEATPLVRGAPLSVAEPVAAERINSLFGIGAAILLVVTVVVVILLAVFVINLLATR